MDSKALLEAAQLAVLNGANPNKLQFCHRPQMAVYEGLVMQPNDKIYFNGSAYVTGEESPKLDEVAIETLVPYVVTVKSMESATPRDWAALFLRRHLAGGQFGPDIAKSYAAQSEAVKWTLAYAYLDKQKMEPMELFKRSILTFFPQATMYVRPPLAQQVDVLVHVPSHARQQAQRFVRLAAQLLLPFYYVTEVVAKEPPALLHAGMPLGKVRLVDAAFESEQQWKVE